MQKSQYIIAVLLCCLAIPAFAADTLEGTAKRVTELEKADLVLQEDLAKTQAYIDGMNNNLKKALDAEVTARKSLAALLEKETAARAAAEEKLTTQMAAEAKDRAASDAAAQAKIAALEKALADQQVASAKQIADLQGALDQEAQARAAAEQDAAKSRDKIVERAKKDRTIFGVLGVLLGGAIAVK